MSFRSPHQGSTPSATPPLPLLRPMEVLELLDEAFDLYKRNFRLFFDIAILLNTPIALLMLSSPIGSTGTVPVLLVGQVISLLTFSALTDAAWDRLLERRTSIIIAFRHGLRRWFWVFTGTLLYLLGTLIGLVLLVIPGLFVGLWSLLLLPVIVVENPGWAGIFQRPWQIPGPNLWRLFFVGLGLSVFAMILWIVLSALVALFFGLGGLDPNRPPDLSNGPGTLIMAGYLLATAVIRSAWIPVFTTALLFAYVDLRIRQESYDLELLAAAMEARVRAERGGVPPGTVVRGQVPG